VEKIVELKDVCNVLRLGVAMCFIGHGACGIITKPIWCNYFAVFGIGHDHAYQLMPWVGSFDILLGVITLIYPIRVIPAWLVFWGILTALLRPLSGEPFAEFIERTGNFGTPLMLLGLVGFDLGNRKRWFTRIVPSRHADSWTIEKISMGLRIVVFLLLAGHGWLYIIHKKSLMDQLHAIHVDNAFVIASTLGLFEITAAFFVLLKPVRSLILILLFWKMASELFYPKYELFEWIERGGSYASLLALWIITHQRSKPFSGIHVG